MSRDTLPETPRLTVETGLYLLIALLALAVRLYGLGAQPLSDAEAHDALLAFRFLHGGDLIADVQTPPVPHSPLLFTLTSFSFLMFGASDTIARLAPALAGTALVLTPVYFRRALGPAASLLMSGLLAISPTLIAASRAADAVMLVALAGMAAIGSLVAYAESGDRRHLVVAAVAVGAGL
ncbi:MAG: glycosyltransferase family 39 protein, partial [Chloroflexi bacterium]|nr:glycosyltransferase family 39 protein [Chloroflexota bacterium]